MQIFDGTWTYILYIGCNPYYQWCYHYFKTCILFKSCPCLCIPLKHQLSITSFSDMNLLIRWDMNKSIHPYKVHCVCVLLDKRACFYLASFSGGIKISSTPKQVSQSVCPFQGLKPSLWGTRQDRRWPSFHPGGRRRNRCLRTMAPSGLIRCLRPTALRLLPHD